MTNFSQINDPLQLGRILWPDVHFYDKQKEIVYSVRDNDETVVVAGNMLGKDFVAGFIALTFFLVPELYIRSKGVATEVRIMTTSVNEKHLDVLWGEMSRFISTSKIPLRIEDGGPLITNKYEIKKMVNGRLDGFSFLVGKVAKKDESMSGAHAAHNLGVIDEASGIEDSVYEEFCKWAKRQLIFGNPHSTRNFFQKMVEGGDILRGEK